MFAKNIIIGLLSLGALVVAIPVDTAAPEIAAPAEAADAAAPPPANRPRPVQGPPGGRPREGPRPGYGNGRGPGWNDGRRPGYEYGPGGFPVVLPVPVLGGLGYNGPAEGLERYCESLNIPTFQLPGECRRFCQETAKGPWWC